MKVFILLLLSLTFLNAKIIVVTNKNSQIRQTKKEIIQYVFLAKINKIGDTKIVPLLSNDNELHKQFCKDVLCKSESQYNSYWARLVFTGRKSISKRLTQEEIIKRLQDLNTVAYIDKKDLKDDWKVIYEDN